MLKRSNLFCSITTHLSEKIYEDNKIEIDHFAINQNATSSYLHNISLSSAKQNQSSKVRNLVYIGAMDKNRDSLFLIDVLSLVLEDVKNVNLVFIGWASSDSYISEMKNHANSLGISQNVKFIGKVPFSDLPKFLLNCDVGLSNIPPTSFYLISSPTKLFNYLSLGLPVVANKEIYDQKEVIESSRGGFAVKYDKTEFADSIKWLLQNPIEALQIGDRGRNWVMKNRTYSILAYNLSQKYLQIINARS